MIIKASKPQDLENDSLQHRQKLPQDRQMDSFREQSETQIPDCQIAGVFAAQGKYLQLISGVCLLLCDCHMIRICMQCIIFRI